MNTNVKISIMALMLSVVTAGCNNTFETKTVIDSEIVITMMESSSQALQMYFSTTKSYSCCNYPIDLSWKKSSNTIDIVFKGVIKADLCLTAIGPATASIDLGVLNNGTYQLNFYNEQVKQSGKLIVSSEGYKTNFADNSNFRFTTMTLNKRPENTIWLAISYREEEVLSSFLEALMNLGASEKTFSRGYYSFNTRYQWLYSGFVVEENGDITYLPDITNPGGGAWGYLFIQSFVFHFTGDSTNIEQLVKQYKEQMEIRVYTDKGEQFLSWMY